jgi:RNA polymerase-binding transcription factor DksA
MLCAGGSLRFDALGLRAGFPPLQAFPGKVESGFPSGNATKQEDRLEEKSMNTESYEKILRDRQRELYRRLHKIEADFEEPRNPDDDDRATERSNDEVLDELGQVGQDELRAIDAALERIAKGTFGTCVKCGSEISEDRLKAVPYTPFCQKCAAAL